MCDELKKLYEEYKEACNMPIYPITEKLLANYIYLAMAEEMQHKRSLAMNKVQAEVEKFIVDHTEVSKKGARKIFEYAHAYGHSGGIHEVFDRIEELVDLFEACKED